ncbi:zinc finger protein 830-like [Pelomyxa schiedti]|nr:zinc finger protein 830-like [Pelomyxa schiedti]
MKGAARTTTPGSDVNVKAAMRQAKSATTKGKNPADDNAAAGKICSPLVKYNAAGNAVCIVCNTTIKDPALWMAHAASKQHNEQVLYFKNLKKQQQEEQRLREEAEKARREAEEEERKRNPPPPQFTLTVYEETVEDDTTQKPSLPTSQVPSTVVSDEKEEEALLEQLETTGTLTSATEEPPASSEFTMHRPPGDDDDTFRRPNPTPTSRDTGALPDLPKSFFDDKTLDARARGLRTPKQVEEDRLRREMRNFQQIITLESSLAEQKNDEIASAASGEFGRDVELDAELMGLRSSRSVTDSYGMADSGGEGAILSQAQLQAKLELFKAKHKQLLKQASALTKTAATTTYTPEQPPASETTPKPQQATTLAPAETTRKREGKPLTEDNDNDLEELFDWRAKCAKVPRKQQTKTKS